MTRGRAGAVPAGARLTVTSGLWYAADLTGDQAGEAYIDVVRGEFGDAIDAAGRPAGACLIVAGRSDQGCATPAETGARHRRIFFSPRSISHVPHLIARYGATPCEAPTHDGAKLLFGAEDDWALLRRDSH